MALLNYAKLLQNDGNNEEALKFFKLAIVKEDQLKSFYNLDKNAKLGDSEANSIIDSIFKEHSSVLALNHYLNKSKDLYKLFNYYYFELLKRLKYI